MVINNNVQAVTGAYHAPRAAQARHADSPSAPQAGAEVVFSDEAQSFSSMLQELKGMDETRPEKVRMIGEQLAAGTYHPSAKDVAASLLALRY